VTAGIALSVAALSAQATNITGAGATFPYPIFAKWAEIYKKIENVNLNYQSIGSSGGLRQIRAKTVTFGASDAPVDGARLDKDGMIQFPVILGGVVMGVLIGFTWEWLREHKYRKTASQRGKELARLEREMEVMRDSSSVPKDEILTLIDKPRKAG
jgi:ABC-type phosphate transport system substrate-binding protein